MNKALVLIEALESIITRVTSQDRGYDTDYEETLTAVHTLAENAVNMVGGREEIESMFEDLRIVTIDLDVAQDHVRDYGEVDHESARRLLDAIIPVLVAVDDLTDYGVSNA